MLTRGCAFDGQRLCRGDQPQRIRLLVRCDLFDGLTIFHALRLGFATAAVRLQTLRRAQASDSMIT